MRKVRVETNRLILRPFSPSDLDELFAIRSDPAVMEFITGSPSTKEEVAASIEKYDSRWSEYGFGKWAVVSKEESRLVGWCGLDLLDTTPEVELGYGLAREAWGRGFVTEAGEASLRYGFESLKLKRIVAVALPGNVGSWRVMEKLGMRYVKDGSYYGVDVVYYEIHRQEFRPSASNFILSDNP